MLCSEGFNLWADGYDESVGLSDDAGEYPFAGYRDVLNAVYRAVRSRRAARVLDIGFGTAVLTRRLYDDGSTIYGVDFSERMIELAQEKMPNAVLLRHDFADGLPAPLRNERFDAIISTYAMHHLSDSQKAALLASLQEHLTPDGIILLGDVAFETRGALEACRQASGDAWDDEERYIVFDELRRGFPAEKLRFEAFSHCAGILTLLP